MRIEKDKELMNILKLLAPGTALREGLENILRAKTGGLVVLGDNEHIMKVVDGGFTITLIIHLLISTNWLKWTGL